MNIEKKFKMQVFSFSLKEVINAFENTMAKLSQTNV